MTETLLHLLNFGYGVGACVACFALFSLCGAALLPGRRRGDSGGDHDAVPAVIGAAVYALLCWYGIKYGIRLNILITAFAGLTAVLAVARRHHVARELKVRGLMTRSAAGWVLVFGLCYGISYLFLPPSVTPDLLPLTTGENQDVFYYLTHTRYLQELGRSNVDGYSFLDIVYLQTPAVFYMLGLVSVCFRFDPLAASMPILFCGASLIGLFAALVSRRAFGISPYAAASLAAVLVAGPFFRYVLYCYFLSTVLAMPVFMHLLWITVADPADRPRLDRRLTVAMGAHYVLLVLLYPVFFFAAIGIQLCALALTSGASLQSANPVTDALPAIGRSALRILAAMCAAVGVTVVLLQSHLGWAYRMALYLSKLGVAGWPMDIIPAQVLFGLPWRAGIFEPARPEYRWVALSVLALLALGLVVAYFWRYRAETSVLERTIVGLAAGALLGYVLYFLRTGPSYQQWKFASYFPLPWSFAVFAAGIRLAGLTQVWRRGSATAAVASAAVWLPIMLAVLLVGGNLYAHARFEPPPARFSGALRDLAGIDKLPWVRELDVHMYDGGSTMLAAYFIRTKPLHMVSRSYYPDSPVSVQQISRSRPYLMQDVDCSGTGHDQGMTIEGVGCLILAPPTIRFETVYPFDKGYQPIDLEGLGPREEGGRWNVRDTVRVSLTADEQAVPLARPAFVNLHLSPYLYPGIPAQRLVMTWGRRGAVTERLDREEWISLPVERQDWTGGPRLSTLSVVIQLPDAASRAVNPAMRDSRPLAVFFGHASVTDKPAGRVVAAGGQPAR